MSDEIKENVEVSEDTKTESKASENTEKEAKQESDNYDLKKGFQGLSDQITEQMSAFFTDLMTGIKQLLNKEETTPETKVVVKDDWI